MNLDNLIEMNTIEETVIDKNQVFRNASKNENQMKDGNTQNYEEELTNELRDDEEIEKPWSLRNDEKTETNNLQLLKS